MEEEALRVRLELNIVGDGRTFLNFWNWMTGEDVITEVKEGKLYDTHTGNEVLLQQFIDNVKSKFVK